MDLFEAESALDQLSSGIRVCTMCPLHASRTHAVPGEGNPRARVMLIGEAPGEEEDRQGRPFVGRAGRFLDELLKRIGLPRKELFITSSVKCRPPRNRVPLSAELETCKAAWLDRQIEILDPCIIVLMGGTPLRQLVEKSARVKDLHGSVPKRGGRVYLVTYHPAAGMRFPEAGLAMQSDFRKLERLASAVMRNKKG